MRTLPALPEIPCAEPHRKNRVIDRLLAEQTAIAAVLTEMDGELVVLEQWREKSRALKQAMTQELVTGRTRLV